MIEEMYRAAAHELAERGARLMHEAVGAQNEATSSDEKLALLAVRTSLDLGSGAIGLSPSCDSSLGASAHNRHRSDPSRCPQRSFSQNCAERAPSARQGRSRVHTCPPPGTAQPRRPLRAC